MSKFDYLKAEIENEKYQNEDSQKIISFNFLKLLLTHKQKIDDVTNVCLFGCNL